MKAKTEMENKEKRVDKGVDDEVLEVGFQSSDCMSREAAPVGKA